MKWTDEMVIEFARVASEGSNWGDYKGLRSIGSKLQRFKALHEKKCERITLSARAQMSRRKKSEKTCCIRKPLALSFSQ